MAQKKPANNRTRQTPPGPAARVDLGEIERILAFMIEHGLEELEYRSGELQVRLRREAESGTPAVFQSTPGTAAAAHFEAAAPPRTRPAPAGRAAEAAPSEHLHIVKSPIVGTFYAAPAPDAPPFVRPGDVVKRGQILCIVEAMKLMNEIEADEDGEVVRQLAENAQPVEYGQPLFALRPAAQAP